MAGSLGVRAPPLLAPCVQNVKPHSQGQCKGVTTASTTASTLRVHSALSPRSNPRVRTCFAFIGLLAAVLISECRFCCEGAKC